ncbi:MAG TPA: class I SAM-dependent rRNA methyltransferase [Opitutaceae bacterium]|nr:class I SAM-dependent rRNA methyltransferase [Opitutaceae bacterium]
MSVPSFKLKPNANSRVLSGHPWVFANEVEAALPPECDGEVVECRDRTGRLLGTGICNGRSQIVWRRLSRDRVALDAAYIGAALERAVGRRAADPFRRLVWSESDDLPGLVSDQFGDAVVIQIQTLAMEKRSAIIGDVVDRLLHPAEIIFRNDAHIRRLEGLELETHTRSGNPWEARWTPIDGLETWLDLVGGQKTGFYLDQRAQHASVAKYCAGKRVLDAFCNQGSFGLHAARAGASRVLGLDSAPEAVDAARRSAARNGVTAEFEVANVFDWLNDPANKAGAAWDVVILDPPPFAKSRSALEGALRGYKEINLRALQRLSPGGVLATYTCSHHVHDADLRSVLSSAAADARRRVRVLEFCHQPPDHPVLVSMPESEYLRGYILRVE